MKNQLQNSDCGRTRRANSGLKEMRDMGGKVLLLTLVVLTFLLVGTGFAFQNEPDGFRGLKWGDPPRKDITFRGIVGEESKAYGLLGEKLQIGDAYLYAIIYIFSQINSVEKLMMVILSFKNEENHNILKTICQGRFGEPTGKGFYKLYWEGPRATIALQYDVMEEEGELALWSTLLGTELQKAQQRKQIERAEEDW